MGTLSDKEFNERTFIRLLGDMHSSNFVLDITPDFEEEQYRIKAIDFDQQSYEGKKNVYLPQFFKENNPIVQLGIKFITVETQRQYQLEEPTQISRRYFMHKERINDLLSAMKSQKLSKEEKTNNLRKELNEFHHTKEFNKCDSMGAILQLNIKLMLADHL